MASRVFVRSLRARAAPFSSASVNSTTFSPKPRPARPHGAQLVFIANSRTANFVNISPIPSHHSGALVATLPRALRRAFFSTSAIARADANPPAAPAPETAEKKPLVKKGFFKNFWEQYGLLGGAVYFGTTLPISCSVPTLLIFCRFSDLIHSFFLNVSECLYMLGIWATGLPLWYLVVVSGLLPIDASHVMQFIQSTGNPLFTPTIFFIDSVSICCCVYGSVFCSSTCNLTRTRCHHPHRPRGARPQVRQLGPRLCHEQDL